MYDFGFNFFLTFNLIVIINILSSYVKFAIVLPLETIDYFFQLNFHVNFAITALKFFECMQKGLWF